MFLVGLTGGISTGKSTVAGMLSKQGAIIVDADIIARQVVEPGKPAWQKIQQAFGSEVFNDDGTLDRAKLGELIFSDEQKRRKLNSITHPEIYKSMLWQILGHFIRGEQCVVLDLPLLFETQKMLPYLSFIIVVSSDNEIQLQRLMARNNLTETEAVQRINAQLPLADKCRKATHVIDNSGGLQGTQIQVDRVWRGIQRSKKHWVLRGALIACVLGVSYTFYKVMVFSGLYI